jgi:HPt (histidine-containing phosphotransfer) domain-containing protein
MIQSKTKPIERIASPPIVPEGPVIDLAHLARMTLGDKRLEAEVLALLDRQADLLLARMREAPPAAAGAFAHTLKGSARGVGAWRVAAAAERVEVAAGSNPATVPDAIAGLAAAVAQVRQAIADLLAAS